MAGWRRRVAARALVCPAAWTPSPDAAAQVPGARRDAAAREADAAAELDLRALLTAHAGSRVTFAEPGAPVLLPGRARRASGGRRRRRPGQRPQARRGGRRAWILVEDWPDEVTVTMYGTTGRASPRAASPRRRAKDASASPSPSRTPPRPGRHGRVDLGARAGHGGGVEGSPGEGGAAVTEQPIKVMVVDGHPMWQGRRGTGPRRGRVRRGRHGGDGEQAVRRARRHTPTCWSST